MSEERHNNEHKLLDVIFKLINVIICLMILAGALLYTSLCGIPGIFLPSKKNLAADASVVIPQKETARVPNVWIAPDTSLIPADENGKLVRYGRMLIANTAYYLGPEGTVLHSCNGMNCQNCHLDAGTKPFGNNYSAVSSTYPKFRERSGKIESIYKRVNDCFERSLNGKPLDTVSREMQGIKAYITWLGAGVNKGEKPAGAGLTELAFMDHPADPGKGKRVYIEKCQSCHQVNGEGKINADLITYQYPPLWGDHSYTTGAGLYRLSRFAGYVRSNMPFGASYDAPQLSDEEAWNVAAYVDSQPRPTMDLSSDWPSIKGKPVDHPFGPYADAFDENQHKYGPFGPIAEYKKKQKEKK
jgi:thiosulfate dehydrogenase